MQGAVPMLGQHPVPIQAGGSRPELARSNWGCWWMRGWTGANYMTRSGGFELKWIQFRHLNLLLNINYFMYL